MKWTMAMHCVMNNVVSKASSGRDESLIECRFYIWIIWYG